MISNQTIKTGTDARFISVCGTKPLFFVVLMLLSTAVMLPAIELNVPRQGVVQNVPVEAPWNGCLLVREGPGMNWPVKGYVTNGTAVKIEATDGAWYRISSPKTGYVYSTYVKITETETLDSSNERALTLEEIVENSKPWTRDANLEERKKLLESNDTAPAPQLPARP